MLGFETPEDLKFWNAGSHFPFIRYLDHGSDRCFNDVPSAKNQR